MDFSQLANIDAHPALAPTVAAWRTALTALREKETEVFEAQKFHGVLARAFGAGEGTTPEVVEAQATRVITLEKEQHKLKGEVAATEAQLEASRTEIRKAITPALRTTYAPGLDTLIDALQSTLVIERLLGKAPGSQTIHARQERGILLNYLQGVRGLLEDGH